MSTEVIHSEKFLQDGSIPNPWNIRMIKSDQCLSFVAWNSQTKEALLIDPKKEDHQAYRSLFSELKGYRWVAVIDTHTHADHISIAADAAQEIAAPLVMHASSLSRRVHIRVAMDTHISTAAGELKLLITPGHTPDSITPIWGPFIFGGDTILFGDTGRDDLPGGSPTDHFESVQKVKANASPSMILLPGHDHKGGRASTWGTQMKVNASLTQDREAFVKEAAAFDAPAPELLKQSLRENFK